MKDPNGRLQPQDFARMAAVMVGGACSPPTQPWTVRPYLGAGAGLSLINVIRTFDPVLTLATGLRIDVTHQWSARVEGDIRSFGFEEGTLGWSLGIARRF